EREQPWRHARQERQMIVGLAGALECDAQECACIRWEGRRKYRVALDDAGVAIGGLLADSCPINQSHAQPAFGEMQRYRRADNSGAENHRIRACHAKSSRVTLYMDCSHQERYQASALIRCRSLPK